nr:immunoglobulin gamma heavy chain [Bos taurus]
MNPLWTLLFVLSAPRGVLSQVQLRESGPSLVWPSQTLSLTCTISGFALKRPAVGWFRQAPGQALEWVGEIDFDGYTCHNPGLDSRLSITRDNSKSQVSLSVSSVTTEDTATYYCARFTGDTGFAGYRCSGYAFSEGEYVDAWGQGLLVTVSSASTTAPK